MTDALEVLEPSGSSVKYRDETLVIVPLKIGQLPKLVRTARPVIDAVLEFADTAEDGSVNEVSADDVALVMDLLDKHSAAVFEAAAICTGKSAAWLEEGGVDEFVELAMKVFEVNRDFFVQRLVPLLGGRAAGLMSMVSGGGRTPSSSSSSTTTASPTSADTPSGSSAPSATQPHEPATGSS